MNKHISPQVDCAAALAFLERLHPGGPWNLVAIGPHTGSTEGATFNDPAKVEKWLTARSGRCNCYYQANPVASPSGAKGRLRRQDIKQGSVLHVDIDVDKLAGGMSGLDARKAATVETLRGLESPPTAVVDTGGGLQCLWRISATTDLDSIERMNAKLVEDLGGDPGTWSISQPLRLPGTMNLPDAKKQARGRVPVPAQLIEFTGHHYEGWEFELAEPASTRSVDVEFAGPEDVEDLAALAAEHHLDERLLTIIENGRLPESKQGDDSRSAWLFDAVCGLARHRVPNEKILGIILDSRFGISESVLSRPEHDQLRYAEHQVRNALARVRDVDGFEDDALNASEDSKANGSVAGLSYVTADQVREKPLNPLWPGRIFIGKLTTGAGIPDQGKSVVTCDITARVTRGLEWPDGRGRAPEGKVIILSAEDDPEDTIKPRLLAAGADTSKVLIVNSLVKQGKGKRMLSISEDLPKLAALARQHPETRLLIIDPINAYIGTSKEHDSFRDSDVRAVLGPVKEWAEEHQIAVLIITHFKKGGSGRAIDQVMGSLAFTALSRSAWAFIEERDKDGQPTGRKLMAKIKQNITAPVDSLAYRLVGVVVGDGIEAPRVEWGEEVKGSADDLMAGTKERGSPKLAQAQLFLIDILAEGPVLASEISRRARELGIAEKTLNRAKEELEVESTQHCEGFEGRWVWRSKADGDDDL